MTARRSSRRAVAVFLVFAFVYFFAALLRGVTATLAPVFSDELGLRASDLGLLGGAFFFGFAALQLPLGNALDRHGPRRTLVVLLALAVAGCLLFATARDLPALVLARAVIGAGVAGCLMAPLTAFRHLYTAPAQLRANAWMLMTGSIGMLASTLPVQWLLPWLGWRGLFQWLAGMLAVSMLLVAVGAPRARPAAGPTGRRRVPRDEGISVEAGPLGATATRPGPVGRATLPPNALQVVVAGPAMRYRDIARHPFFVRLVPLGFFVYGGLIAVQSLWAGPWLTEVAGQTPGQAAHGLFVVNLAMLAAFFGWGLCMPRLARRGVDAAWLIARGLPVSFALLALNIALGAAAGAGHWAAWCAACTFVSASQPALGQAYPAAAAGRALSAFNLVIFAGVFAVQWGIGLAVDAFVGAGLAPADGLRLAMAGFGACCLASYAWFLCRGSEPADNHPA